MSIGLSLGGMVPISMFPRFDFLICAMNQLVNHLDKFHLMSCGKILPKVIIKTLVGSTWPLHPGFQHCGDYTQGLRSMLNNVEIIKLTTDIISTSEGNRTSMSKFEKIIKHSDENVMSVDLTENVKEADEVTEDYWNHLLPGFGSAMEKPKKWRKKLTEDIPVKFNNTRKWTQ
jgi:hypothetical protein